MQDEKWRTWAAIIGTAIVLILAGSYYWIQYDQRERLIEAIERQGGVSND